MARGKGTPTKFAAEYAKDQNGQAAAIRAGYLKASAAVTASRLLKKANVQALIAASAKRTMGRIEVSVERVLLEAARLAFSDIRRAFDEKGRLKPVHELDDDTAAALASIEVDELFEGVGKARKQTGYTKKIKVADKNPAVERLMKHLGLFAKDNDQKANGLRDMLNYIAGAKGSRGIDHIKPQKKRE